MMRPTSIAAFEIVQIALAVATFILSGGGLFEKMFGLVLLLTLVLFISRRRSNVARWIFVVMVGLGLAIQAWLWIDPPAEMSPLRLAQLILGVVVTIISVSLLFVPTSSRWFRRSEAVAARAHGSTL